MKKFEWYPIYWNYIGLSIFWINLFVLLASGFANWLLLRENARLSSEAQACRQVWDEFNQKLDDGEIIIQLQKEDLRR